MTQVLVNLKDISKAEEFMKFIQYLDFVDSVALLEEEEKEETKTQYYTPKSSYTVEDIEAIAAQFPEDKKWTYADLEKYFPKDLKIKVEILNNRLIIMPSPSFIHQKISMKLSRAMDTFVEEQELGDVITAPMDTKFDEDNLEQPDILFISIKRSAIIEKNVINGAPDLIVEIISPSNHKKEREEKHSLYEISGVQEYWTIFPKKRSVKIEVLEEGKYELFSEATKEGKVKSSVLEGFEISIKDLMPEKFFAQENE